MNEQVVRRVFEQCINNGKLEGLNDLVADTYVGPGGLKGAEGFAATVRPLRAAFPDIHYDLLEIVSHDDVVAVRWRWKGTHTAHYKTFAPTQKHIENDGAAFFHVRDGKLTSGSVLTDRVGFLVQVGAVPADVVPR